MSFDTGPHLDTESCQDFRHIRRCIDDIPSDPEEPSPSEEERDKWLIRVSVKCAEDLKAILDDFMVGYLTYYDLAMFLMKCRSSRWVILMKLMPTIVAR